MKRLHQIGLRGWHLHLAGLVHIIWCLALWLRAKTLDQAERGHAERRALYVGLWPATFWMIGDELQRYEARRSLRRRLSRG